MEFKQTFEPIFELGDAFTAGDLAEGKLYFSGIDYTPIKDERHLFSAYLRKQLYIKVPAVKIFRGVELPAWAHCLTWDKNGGCLCWCKSSSEEMVYNALFWVSNNNGVCERVNELNAPPYTDDSWKNSLIKL